MLRRGFVGGETCFENYSNAMEHLESHRKKLRSEYQIFMFLFFVCFTSFHKKYFHLEYISSVNYFI